MSIAMLTIPDSIPFNSTTRRRFLCLGAITLGGLALGDIPRLWAQSPSNKSPPKSVIMIHLSGGPSHIDMYDMKPTAPSEYRGEFRPIKTNVPGIEICELMQHRARIADKFTIVRGAQISHLHTANEFYSGYPWQDSPRAAAPGEAQRPTLGAIVSRLRGGPAEIPPYVSLDNKPDWELAYYCGVGARAVPRRRRNAREALENLSRPRSVSDQRVSERTDLLHSHFQFRRFYCID